MVVNTVTIIEFLKYVPNGWLFQASIKLLNSGTSGTNLGGKLNTSVSDLIAVMNAQIKGNRK
jgi:hypothetical protein